MVGKLKILVLLFIFLFGSCKKQNNLAINGKQIITQNINILIDSIEGFDMSKIPRPEKFKKIKIEKFTVGLLDSILIVDNQLDGEMVYNRFNLEKQDLINFKSDYKIKIVKINNYDTNILFVNFFNFKIQDNKASIEVKKKIGISMVHHKYYFEKENDIWVFKKKVLLGMG